MIRKAKKIDVNRIHELLKQIRMLHKELYPEYFASLEDSKYNIDEIEELICDSSKNVYVYEENQVLGYIIGYYHEDYFFVDDLCVDINHKHKHIGSKLMEFIEENITAEKIMLNVWVKNEVAVRFYEQQGYEPLKYVMVKKKGG